MTARMNSRQRRAAEKATYAPESTPTVDAAKTAIQALLDGEEARWAKESADLQVNYNLHYKERYGIHQGRMQAFGELMPQEPPPAE